MEVVIARYTEDLQWLERFPELTRVTIYDKSDQPWPGSITAPNVGREAETFARFIVDKYEEWECQPSRTIAFLQGYPFDHVDEETLRNRLLSGDHDCPVFLGASLTCDENGAPHHPGLPLREKTENVFGTTRQKWTFCPGAQYAVPTSRILTRSLEWWKQLHANILSGFVCPWTMERLWPEAFGV